MFCDIKTHDFFFCTDTKSYCMFKNCKYDCHCNCCVCCDTYNTQYLYSKLVESATIKYTIVIIEKSDCYCTPKTITSMNGYGTYRVINF